MRLSTRLEAFWKEHPEGIVLMPATVDALALKAIHFYSGWGDLENVRATESPLEALDPDYCVDDSDWAIIRPLFELYVEHQNAMELEATRGLGLDVYGRAVDTIKADITVYEDGLPKKAFFQECQTI